MDAVRASDRAVAHLALAELKAKDKAAYLLVCRQIRLLVQLATVQTKR